MNPRRYKTFTLLELLVVIAIIAILLSILMPSLTKARQKTQIAVCMSNMNQIGKGTVLFAKSYDERVPFGSWTAYRGNYFMVPDEADEICMLGTLFYSDILTAKDIYFCPSKNNARHYDFEPGDTFIRSDYTTRPFLGSDSYLWRDFYSINNPTNDMKVAISRAPVLHKFEGSEAVLGEKFGAWSTTVKIHTGDGMNVLKIDGSSSWNKFGAWADPLRPALSLGDQNDALLRTYWENQDEL